MMTLVRKNYASLIAVQEGNIVPEDEQLDIKGIEALHKSTKSITTRMALQKILMEDILKAPVIDQLKFVKDIAVFEKQIVLSIRSGSKEYYKPATIKSAKAYADPMRIQGIKASIAWNEARNNTDLPAINLDERNAIFIAKTTINWDTIEIIKDTYPVIYDNFRTLLCRPEFGYEEKKMKSGVKIVHGEIKAIAIPFDEPVPEWLMEFIDYTALINENIGGFPYESIGIQRLNRGSDMNYTNIVQL